MIVARKTRVVGNPSSQRQAARQAFARQRAAKRRPRTQSNPAYLLTLGPANPAKRSHMAKPKRKRKRAIGRANPVRRTARKTKSHRRRTPMKMRASNPRRRARRRNPSRRTVKVYRRTSHRSKNPFGVNMSTKQIGEIVGGAILGGGLTKVAATTIASNVSEISASGPLTVLTNFGVAAGLWFIASKASKDFGFGVGLGGLVVSVDSAINTFLPSAAGYIPGGGLSGYRHGIGDLVPGRLLEPYNPFASIANQSGGMAMSPAYPAKYTRAA